MRTQVDAYAITRCYLQDYASTLGPDLSNKLSGWVRSRSLVRLAGCSSLLSTGSTSYSAGQWKALLQIEAFFKKNSSLEAGIDKKQVALERFREAEAQCDLTNQALDSCIGLIDSDLQIQRARRYIAKVLGPFPQFLEDIPGRIKVTSGATNTTSKAKSAPYLKVNHRLACTPGAEPYLRTLSKYFGYGDVLRPRLTVWNRVTTVDKNWKTDRTIACEPGGNIPLQLAFDGYAKGRLRKYGIDLADQSWNQHLAYLGSKYGSLSTLDLEMASDTVAYNTVALLFPYEWFQFLCAVRSPYYKFGKREEIAGKYHKFSSMGNGTTFAIETLIFASLCYAVGSHDFSVYGDDLVIETELYEDLVSMLESLGFTVNAEKSWHEGPYRESCGSHYHSGTYITPFYLRSHGSNKADLCHIVNGLADLGFPGSSLWRYCKSVIAQASLPLVPFDGTSTSGVWIDTHSAYHRRLIRTKVKRFYGIPVFKAYTPELRSHCDESERSYFLWHLAAGKAPSDRILPVRSSQTIVDTLTTRYKRGWRTFIPKDPRCSPPWLSAWADYLSTTVDE